MVKILKGKQLIEYNDDLFENDGKISFKGGNKLHINANGKYIVPGFIDRHTHGGYGVDYMDADIAGNERLFRNLLAEGITTVLPTTLTQSDDQIKLAVNSIINAKSTLKKDLIHLEGPFINIKKKGAQNPKYIKKPDIKLLQTLPKKIKMISYAPEFDLNHEFITYLVDNKIVGSIVHSDAKLNDIISAYDNGLVNFSHFYNGSNSYTHRDGGVVNAGLLLDDVFLELICDGFHIDPLVVKTTYKLKGIDSIVLITDSMRAKGLEDGEYDLGGQQVVLQNDQVRLKSGSLAGSVLKMNDAVKNFHKYTNCPLGEAFYAASTNVANSLNIKDTGQLCDGYFADVVVLDEQLNVIQTFVNGQVQFNID